MQNDAGRIKEESSEQIIPKGELGRQENIGRDAQIFFGVPYFLLS
jgi:hypothetical protein